MRKKLTRESRVSPSKSPRTFQQETPSTLEGVFTSKLLLKGITQ
jgi:hypothetical protein